MPVYDDNARNAAEEFRAENGLGIAPIADVVALIEQTQAVDVAVLGVDDSNEHGLTMVDPARGATLVAVASSNNPMRWRSTLAHELAHLIFEDHSHGKPGVLSAGSAVERRAQSFARHVLIPLPGVRHFLERHNQPLKLEALSDLVQRFQVSPAVAAIQLRDSGAINTPRYTEWSGLYTPTLAARFGWADQYKSLQAESRQRRAPQRLLARVIDAYIAGLVSLETVASVRGVAARDLAAELHEAGIKPTARIDEPDEDDFFAGADPDVDLSWLDDA